MYRAAMSIRYEYRTTLFKKPYPFPHFFYLDIAEVGLYQQMIEWLEEHLGPYPNSGWYTSPGNGEDHVVVIAMKDEQKAFEFRMRWS